MERQQLLSQIKKLVLQQEPLAEIILYGSHARGDYLPDSDMDILILLDKEKITRDDEKSIAYPLYDLELSTSQVISPFIRSKKIWHEKYPNTPLYINIHKEGIRL
ncbi:MAG: nucleotidyltransferase domain-containing protein [Bacteroidota bacterium]|nr:nucleotidyltransferase domain-containing protein [Bacteroidota bacterium]